MSSSWAPGCRAPASPSTSRGGGGAAGATGRSSGFVRMHYDLESESRLAWASYPYFRDWAERVGAGDCGFVRTGFVMLVTEALGGPLRGEVALHQRIGVRGRVGGGGAGGG